MKALVLSAALFGAAVAAETLDYRAEADFGEGDTLGAIHNLGDAGVLAASQLVRTGKSYPLGMVSSADMPVWGARKFGVEVVGVPLDEEGKLFSAQDDRWVTHVGIGTQIDGLGHLGIDGYFYNGLRSEDFLTPDGLTQLGVEHLPPIVTRGVLLDVAGYLGKKQLAASEAINADLVRKVAKHQGVSIGKGDVVLLHTGWMDMMQVDAAKFIGLQPGVDLSAARYLVKLGVVAVGSDTGALEVRPSSVATHPYRVHGLLLANYGVYVLENIVTRDLAADETSEFLFVLGQPRLATSVQAIINPVAIR